MTRYVLRRREYRRADFFEVDYEYELTSQDLKELAEQGVHESDSDFTKQVLKNWEWEWDDFKISEEDERLANVGEFVDSTLELQKMEV